MSNNNIKWAFNFFWSSSNKLKQSSLIFYGDQEILPLQQLEIRLFSKTNVFRISDKGGLVISWNLR